MLILLYAKIFLLIIHHHPNRSKQLLLFLSKLMGYSLHRTKNLLGQILNSLFRNNFSTTILLFTSYRSPIIRM